MNRAKNILLIVGISFVSVPFWVTMGWILLYVCPESSPFGAAMMSVFGYLGTITIAIWVMETFKSR